MNSKAYRTAYNFLKEEGTNYIDTDILEAVTDITTSEHGDHEDVKSAARFALEDWSNFEEEERELELKILGDWEEEQAEYYNEDEALDL